MEEEEEEEREKSGKGKEKKKRTKGGERRTRLGLPKKGIERR